MIIRLLAFSEKGLSLAQGLASALDGKAQRCNAPLSLADWTARAFAEAEALVFVGAAGIAVRAIAPHVRSKVSDPAVVVVDECGHFAVPILSGHLGGANELARRIARLTGATPVLTTATDANGVFAVDEWARAQGCAVVHPERIVRVSSRLLAGDTVFLRSDWPVQGKPPQNVALADGIPCDFALSIHPVDAQALHIVPRIAHLGVGCRRGIAAEALEAALQALLNHSGICEQAIVGACSIDLKQNEPGLLAFCRGHGWQLRTFSAEQLRAAPGEFTPSAFVQSVTGVDNVCERSAVLGSGGTLYWRKEAGNGVTMALALAPFAPDWRWHNE